MTRVTMTTRYSELDNWPGRLFQAEGATIFNARTATTFAFTYPAGHDFAGFRITVTGTGFSYVGGTPIAGNITRIVVTNGSSQTVLTFDNFTANTLASDLSQFAASVFGARDAQGNGPGADGEGAWSMLLSGRDVINGTNGNDERGLEGFNAGNDTFNMLGGDDYVAGGVGNDTIFGGAGYDQISFEPTTYTIGSAGFRGISVNMTTGKLTDCWGGTDTFSGIERITGSRFNDVFVGSAGRDDFSGLRGADTFNGGADQDRVRYDNDYWQGGRLGIVVDLETSNVAGVIRGSIRDGFGNTDTVIDIERVVGTRYADVFVGSSAQNVFEGGEGKDSFNGGGDFDMVGFGRNFTDQARVGINVDLSRATNQVINDGFGNAETLISIEGISGSQLNDRIKGSVRDETLEGVDGRDTLIGGGGNDQFYFDGQFELGDGDRITDFVTSGATTRDTLIFNTGGFDNMTTTLRLVNGANATTAAGVGQFVYNAVNDTLYWDSNGSAAGGRMSVAVLVGVGALTAANFELF